MVIVTPAHARTHAPAADGERAVRGEGEVGVHVFQPRVGDEAVPVLPRGEGMGWDGTRTGQDGSHGREADVVRQRVYVVDGWLREWRVGD